MIGDVKQLALRMSVVRVCLIFAGAAAIVWAVAVLPVFRSEQAIIAAATAIKAGEIYAPDILQAIEAKTHRGRPAMLRPSNGVAAAVIRLRMLENSFRLGGAVGIDRHLGALSQSLDEALNNAPYNSFLWLARYWVDSTRNGLRPDGLRDLKMSYDVGRYEGWIALKRNRYALAVFSSLPDDLANLATAEFADLVRWGLARQAADIAAGPGRPIRAILYERLKHLKLDRRRAFARIMYRRGLDDVAVPGIDPPRPSHFN